MANQRPRSLVDGRFSDGETHAALRHRADPLARTKLDARPIVKRDRREHGNAVCDIGIIPRELHYLGANPLVSLHNILYGNRQGRPVKCH